MASIVWGNVAALVVIASLATWLAGILRLTKSRKGMAITASLAALFGLVPVGGVSGAGMVLSLSPSLSVAGTALWGGLLLNRVKTCGPACRGCVRSLTLLMFAVSLLVCISFVGGLGPDVYDSGYGFTFWDIILGAFSVMMFIRGSWVSIVLLACLLAHSTGIIMSSNIFDTLIDGPAFVLSALLLLRSWFTLRQ